MADYQGHPLYLAVATSIRDRILDGTYEPGSQLPSDRTLMEQFGVSRHVVTAAWQVLFAEGHAYGHQGKGRFVRRPPERQPFDVDRPLVDGSVRVIADVTVRPPLPAEREQWALPLGTAVFVVAHSWLAADGSEVDTEETVLPADRYSLRYGRDQGESDAQ